MSAALRILHVAPSFYPAVYWGGPIFAQYGLVCSLASLPEVEIKVLTTDSAGPAVSQKLNSGEIDAGAIFPNFSVLFSHRLAGRSTSIQLLSRLPGLLAWADVVHLSATYSFPVLPTVFACRLYRKPLAWSPHGAILDSVHLKFSPKKKWKRIWENVLGAAIDPDKTILIANSAEEQSSAARRLPGLKTTVIPIGVDVPQEILRGYPKYPQPLRLLFLGRLDPKKGLENIFKALEIINDRSITLLICGSGDQAFEAQLRLLAGQAGLLDGRVIFSGAVAGRIKEEAFRDADIFVLPSHSESFGVAIAEALAHGLPVIVSRNTPWQRVEEKGCGLWVENDPQSLADAIRRIRKMNLLAMGQKGREWMQAEYGWDSVARAMLEVYRSLCDVREN